ncbi:MAG: glycoside hydrolase family 127 protein, partial [Maribacter sp.]|nr:glycoside hydrolase family 127 protein [Maribacter sp.]
VNFEFDLSSNTQFPFHLRIPSWANNPTITVNGKRIQAPIENNIAILNREWKNGDKISLTMPMKITTSQWYEFSRAIERGPLVYSLKIRAEHKKKNRGDHYGEFTEVFAKDDWNYGLIKEELENIPESVQIIENNWDESYPWNLDNVPVELRMKGVQLPQWKSVNGNPVFPGFWGSYYQKEGFQNKPAVRPITLVPYGCTTLRITEFPVYDIPKNIQ